MHELSRDVTPMWDVEDHDVSVYIRPYLSKFLSNCSFPHWRLSPRGLPACSNIVSFDNSLLLRFV